MLKVLRGIPATLPVAIEGEDGPLTLTAPPTVTVFDADGLSVVTGASTGTGGAYTYSMAAQSRLGPYTAKFDGTYQGLPVSVTTPFEVVGGYLFSVPALRAFDDRLADATRYPADAVKGARGYVDDEFRKIARRAFTPRAAVETVSLINGVFVLDNMDPYRVVSAKVDGVTVDPSAFTLLSWGEGVYAGDGSTLTIEYEYGLTSVPDDVKRAALIRARTVLYDADSAIPDRAMSYNVDGTQYSLATAGRAGFETGIPEVDAIMTRYRVKPPGVA